MDPIAPSNQRSVSPWVERKLDYHAIVGEVTMRLAGSMEFTRF